MAKSRAGSSSGETASLPGRGHTTERGSETIPFSGTPGGATGAVLLTEGA